MARHVGALGEVEAELLWVLTATVGWKLLRVLTATVRVEVAHLGVDELTQRLL